MARRRSGIRQLFATDDPDNAAASAGERPAQGYAPFHAARGPTALLVAPGAGHVGGGRAGPQRYEPRPMKAATGFV